MQQSIARSDLILSIRCGLDEYPAVALFGARQVGKTTLARLYAVQQDRLVTIYDLERPSDLAALTANPEQILSALEGLVIIDEVQRLPQLFEILRPIVDEPNNGAQFLLLGSASWDLIRGVSETLAGRIHFVDVGGFNKDEVGPTEQTLLALGQRDAYFYAAQRGAELDLLLLRNGQRWGFEFKCSDAPTTTKSMHTTAKDLRLDHLWIVYPGARCYPLSD